MRKHKFSQAAFSIHTQMSIASNYEYVHIYKSMSIL